MEKLIKLFNNFRSALIEDLRDSYNNSEANFDKSEEALKELQALTISSRRPKLYDEVIDALVESIKGEFNELKGDVIKYLGRENRNKEGYVNGINSSLDKMYNVFKDFIKGAEPGRILLDYFSLIDPIERKDESSLAEFCNFVYKVDNELAEIEKSILEFSKETVDVDFLNLIGKKIEGVELDIENEIKYSHIPNFSIMLEERRRGGFNPTEYLINALSIVRRIVGTFFSTNLIDSLETSEDVEKFLNLFLNDLLKIQKIFNELTKYCKPIDLTADNKINMIKKSLHNLSEYFKTKEHFKGNSSIDELKKSLEKINNYLTFDKKSELTTDPFIEARNALEDVISKLKYSDDFIDKSLFSTLSILNDLVKEKSSKTSQNLDSPQHQIPAVYRTPDQDFTKNTKDFGEIQNYTATYPEKISKLKSNLSCTKLGNNTFYYKDTGNNRKLVRLLADTSFEKPTNIYLVNKDDEIEETNILIEKPEENEYIVNVDKIDEYLDNPYCLNVVLKPIRIINAKQLYFNDVNVQEYNKRKVLSNHGEVISESPDGYYVRTPEADYNIYVHKVDVIKEE